MELKIHDQEILLQKLWKSRKLFSSPLTTSTGQTVEVIFAGLENIDAGPDFQDAVLKIDGRLIKGDIEVHLNVSGWYEHGHHRDAKYNRVVLHLTAEPVEKDSTVEREDGVRVPQIYVDLKNYYTLPSTKKSETKSDRDNLIVENCPLSKTKPAQIMQTIQIAGEKRLLEKVDRFREELIHTNWDQLIYQHIMEALGYSKNEAPFRRLARLISFHLICREMQWVPEEMAIKKCAALLFGGAGLLPSQIKAAQNILDSDTVEYIGPIEFLWDQLSHHLEIKPMKAKDWQFFRLRPQNFPTRRIAGMVQIVKKFYRTGFLDGFLHIFKGNEDYKAIINELESSLMVPARGYWHQHYRFDESLREALPKKSTALIGRDRVRDIVVNIILPVLYLYGENSQDGKLQNRVKEIYVKFPKLSENSITRAMQVQLFGRMVKGVIQNSQQQQGLIFLHKLFCRSLKCDECLSLTRSNV